MNAVHEMSMETAFLLFYGTPLVLFTIIIVVTCIYYHFKNKGE